MIQSAIALLIVLLALGYMGMRFYRAAKVARQADGCGASCGCDSPAKSGHSHG